jgi:hypothetical protein
MSGPVPALGHFIWFGKRLPWIYALGVRSAARRGGLQRVVLHHADPLDEADCRELGAEPRVELRPLQPESVLESTGALGPRLVDLYQRLTAPAARANVVRAALLVAEGGVYLDTDTVTVATLDPLREAGGVFCGEERLVFPASVTWRRPGSYALALARTAVRDAMRRVPDGWRAFRRIEHLYPRAVNNAVLGGTPGHPFFHELLGRMVAVPASRQRVRYELGTKLLERTVSSWRGADLRVLEPSVFYPLGPEISQHWFRTTRAVRLDQMLLPDTRVVHWYASVRTRAVIPAAGPAWIRRHAAHQPFSALVLPLLDPA